MQNKITDIVPQKNNAQRYSVYINDAFAFGIDAFDLLRLSLKPGDVFSDTELKNIKNSLDESKCREYANRLVCSKMYTKEELVRKLSLKLFSSTHIDSVLSDLEAYGYIDDLAYAKQYANECKAKYGIYKIRQKLREKGVAQAVIEQALSNFQESNAAHDILRKKLMRSSFDVQNKQKYIDFLARRGFSYDEARDAINTYLEEVEEFDDE